MSICPKCYNIGFFTGAFCPKHQKEYEEYLNSNFEPQPCECGNNEWKDGVLKINQAGDLQDIYRCNKCNEAQLEKCEKWVRIRFRNIVKENKTESSDPHP